MLTVSRKSGQAIVIQTRQGDIVVQVEQARRDRFYVRVVAPDNMKVLREELLEKGCKGDDAKE